MASERSFYANMHHIVKANFGVSAIIWNSNLVGYLFFSLYNSIPSTFFMPSSFDPFDSDNFIHDLIKGLIEQCEKDISKSNTELEYPELLCSWLIHIKNMKNTTIVYDSNGQGAIAHKNDLNDIFETHQWFTPSQKHD